MRRVFPTNFMLLSMDFSMDQGRLCCPPCRLGLTRNNCPSWPQSVPSLWFQQEWDYDQGITFVSLASVPSFGLFHLVATNRRLRGRVIFAFYNSFPANFEHESVYFTGFLPCLTDLFGAQLSSFRYLDNHLLIVA